MSRVKVTLHRKARLLTWAEIEERWGLPRPKARKSSKQRKKEKRS